MSIKIGETYWCLADGMDGHIGETIFPWKGQVTFQYDDGSYYIESELMSTVASEGDLFAEKRDSLLEYIRRVNEKVMELNEDVSIAISELNS